MKRSRNVITALIMGGLALGLQVTAAVAGPPETPPDERPERGSALAQAAARAHALGIYRAPDGSAVVRTPRGSRERPVIPSDEPNVSVVPSRFTQDEVDRLSAQIALRDWAPNAKQFAYGFSYSAELDAIEVATDADALNQAAIRARFGDRVTLRVGTGGGRRGGRRNVDYTSPHYGAAYIRQGDGGFGALCSSGFAIMVSGVPRMLTANHCFRQSIPYYGLDVETAGSPYYYGTVQSSSAAPPYPSYEFKTMQILANPGTYAGRIYTGSSTSNTTARVLSANTPCTGCSPYYFSGGASGEHCCGTVQSLQGTYCDSDGCTYYLAKVTGLNPIEGDSGSPFYAKAADGNVHVRGITVADDVYGYSYFENWGTIQSYYNASVITG